MNIFKEQLLADFEHIRNKAVLLSQDYYGQQALQQCPDLQRLISLEGFNPHVLTRRDLKRYNALVNGVQLTARGAHLRDKAAEESTLQGAYQTVMRTCCLKESGWHFRLTSNGVEFTKGCTRLSFDLSEDALLDCITIMLSLINRHEAFDRKLAKAMRSGKTTFSTNSESALYKTRQEQRNTLLAKVGLGPDLQPMEES